VAGVYLFLGIRMKMMLKNEEIAILYVPIVVKFWLKGVGNGKYENE
jgi:hypothetical protein